MLGLSTIVSLLSISTALAAFTEDRDLSSFTGIKVAGPFNVSVKKQAQRTFLAIVADVTDPNVIPAIETLVQDETLSIRFLPPYDHNSGIFDGRIQISVATNVVSSLELTGSGTLIQLIRNNIPSFRLVNSGSGKLSSPITCDHLNATLSGSGTIAMTKSGDVMPRAVSATVDLSGSGSFEGGDLRTNFTWINLAGSGSIFLNVHNQLSGVLTGSGSVWYGGNPNVTVKITGSGKVCSQVDGTCHSANSVSGRNKLTWFAVLLFLCVNWFGRNTF